MKKTWLVSFAALIVLSNKASAYKSNNIQGFAVSHCYEKKCVEASGEIAFMSGSQDLLVARKATLILSKDQFFCESFRFDVRSQEMVCENSNAELGPTLIIDSKLKILTLTRFVRKKDL